MSAAADATGDGATDDEGLEPPGELPDWFSPDEGERVEWVGEPAAVSLVPAAIWGVVLLPLLGLGLVVFASAYLTRENTDYVVTNETLYHKRGVLSTNIESLGVDRIQNTEYTQSFVGTQLGYGTIEISTAGSSGSDVTFRSVEQPRAVRDLVTRVSKTAGGTDGTGGRSDRADDGEAPDEAAGGGVADDLVEEIASELRTVNESMTNVERLLREQRGGAGPTPPASSGPPDAEATDDTGGTAGGGEATGADDPGDSGGGGDAADSGAGGSSGSTGSASDFVRDDDEEDGPPAPPFGEGS